MTPGTTSRMRADTLAQVRPNSNWHFVDTDPPLRQAGRLLRSSAFRWKVGPVVKRINEQVQAVVDKQPHGTGERYDLVWVDKGVYLWPETVRLLRDAATRLIYYTPDTAFYANRSRHFNRSASMYDLVVTTKSFEMEQYHRLLGPDRVHLTTQAYDDSLHRLPGAPTVANAKTASSKAGGTVVKEADVVFIGLCEPDREACIKQLLTAGLSVRIGGRGWAGFLKKFAGAENLEFLGETVFGADYVHAYQSARVGLGLLSKRFPELHTTRTFEIPACGALLATQRNSETSGFFDDDEVEFFESYKQLSQLLKTLLATPDALDAKTRRGTRRVQEGPYRYCDVVGGALRAVGNS